MTVSGESLVIFTGYFSAFALTSVCLSFDLFRALFAWVQSANSLLHLPTPRQKDTYVAAYENPDDKYGFAYLSIYLIRLI